MASHTLCLIHNHNIHIPNSLHLWDALFYMTRHLIMIPPHWEIGLYIFSFSLHQFFMSYCPPFILGDIMWRSHLYLFILNLPTNNATVNARPHQQTMTLCPPRCQHALAPLCCPRAIALLLLSAEVALNLLHYIRLTASTISPYKVDGEYYIIMFEVHGEPTEYILPLSNVLLINTLLATCTWNT